MKISDGKDAVEKIFFLNNIRHTQGVYHVMAAMLLSDKLDFSVKELSGLSGSSEGSVNTYLKSLVFAGWVAYDKGRPRRYYAVRSKVLEDYTKASKKLAKMAKALTKPQVVKTEGGESIETRTIAKALEIETT